MKLSDRLTEVASFVTKGNRLADIGTDHAYIPIYLVKNGVIPSAIAMDINGGPLIKAKKHIDMYGMSDKIEVRMSDGLERLSEGEADTVLIAGMGGRLICDILKKGMKTAYAADELILSPHSEVHLVREYLWDNHYNITREAMVRDKGKYYTIIKAVRSDVRIFATREEYIYGKYLNAHQDKVFAKYLDDEYVKLKSVLSELYEHKINDDSKIKEIKDKIYDNRRYYNG